MYIHRANTAIIEASILRPCVTAIIGPRRVGKSYFIAHYASMHPEWSWVNLTMDKMEQAELIKKGQLERLIQEQAKQLIGAQKIWVIIDEAQKCPELFNQIKVLYDTFKDSNTLKFIITGSAVLSLHQLSAESLAGRVEIYHLNEFNLHESTLLTEKNLPAHSLLDHLTENFDPHTLTNIIREISPFQPALNQQLKHALIWGGLPEILTLSNTEDKSIYLNNYVQTYLEKDIRAIETITDISLYRHLLEITAEQTGSIRDDQRITQALQCKRDTLKKYRGYLNATLLYQDIYPYIGSSLKRLIKSPKGYLLNNGIISILTGLTQLTVLEKTGTIGHRFENWFLNELNTWLSRIALPSSIYYWRTSNHTEVDFVVVKKPSIFPFEITYSQAIDRKKIRNLITFLGDEPKAKWGFYIYRGEYLIDKDNKIVFIPCWAIS